LIDPIRLRSRIGVSGEDEAVGSSNGAETIIGRVEQDLSSASNMGLVSPERDFSNMQFERPLRSQVPENGSGAIDTIIKKDDDFE
jgi:hypothetical protein